MGKRKVFGRTKLGKSGDRVVSELGGKESLRLHQPFGTYVMQRLCPKGHAGTEMREKHHLWLAFHQRNSKYLVRECIERACLARESAFEFPKMSQRSLELVAHSGSK